jgi:hypothetical protein
MDDFASSLPSSWTLIICTPSDFFMRNALFEPLSISQCRAGVVIIEEAMLETIGCCMESILQGWEQLWNVLNSLFEEDQYATFMKPDEYVHLLYDEASFPRSRFYFWAIGCLSAFEDNISTNLRHLKVFRQNVISQVQDRHGRSIHYKTYLKHIRMLDDKLEKTCKEMEGIAGRLQKRLTAVQALRDGVSSAVFMNPRPPEADTKVQLFSASGVMESRQSRILSENVRLLTLVSIFFLPLSFIIVSFPFPTS